MNNIVNKILLILFPRLKKYGNYAKVIVFNKFKSFFKRKQNHFLFILSPPFCGSTLLNEIISTSKLVSVNNNLGTREGQKLPTVKRIMFDHENRWDDELRFNYSFIKQEWMKYWDLTKPILLEKSPPNIRHTQDIIKNFTNPYFIIFYRNPYAHCESLMRRNQIGVISAAKFALKCLKYQKENILFLENKTIISYEELTDDTLIVKSKIDGIFEDYNLNVNIENKFKAHNYLKENMKIRKLNKQKIEKISKDNIKIMNTIFIKEIELINFFGYELINI
jgi:hypothetical protein